MTIHLLAVTLLLLKFLSGLKHHCPAYPHTRTVSAYSTSLGSQRCVLCRCNLCHRPQRNLSRMCVIHHTWGTERQTDRQTAWNSYTTVKGASQDICISQLMHCRISQQPKNAEKCLYQKNRRSASSGYSGRPISQQIDEPTNGRTDGRINRQTLVYRCEDRSNSNSSFGRTEAKFTLIGRWS